MQKILVILDDESAKVLASKKNKSKFVRESIKYMSMDITPDTMDGMRKSYVQLTALLKEIDSKIDFLFGASKRGEKGTIQASVTKRTGLHTDTFQQLKEELDVRYTTPEDIA